MTKPIPTADDIKKFLDNGQRENLSAIASGLQAFSAEFDSFFNIENRGFTHAPEAVAPRAGGIEAAGNTRASTHERTARYNAARKDVFFDTHHNREAQDKETGKSVAALLKTLEAYAAGETLNGIDQLNLTNTGALLEHSRNVLNNIEVASGDSIKGVVKQPTMNKVTAALQAFEGEKGLDAAVAKLPGATADNPFRGVLDAMAPLIAKGEGPFARRAAAEKAAKQGPRTPGGS